MKPGNSGGGNDPHFRCAFEDGEGMGRLAMSLQTSGKIRSLQRRLYCKGKAQPAFRFYVLYDKICRNDILSRAYKLARTNAGTAGVDGITFEQIDASGLEAWLAGLRNGLVTKTYRPDPVRRVMILKPGGGERPLVIPTIRDRLVQAAAKIVWSRSSRRILWAALMDVARVAARSMRSRKCTGCVCRATRTLLTPICRQILRHDPALGLSQIGSQTHRRPECAAAD